MESCKSPATPSRGASSESFAIRAKNHYVGIAELAESSTVITTTIGGRAHIASLSTVGMIISTLGACSPSSTPEVAGGIVVVLTIDWEGAYISPDGLDAIADLRTSLGAPPLTHFVSAAYFTKQRPDPTLVSTLAAAIHRGDELAVHLHAWQSLAAASRVEAKLSPSFLTGTDKVLEFEDQDRGFDVDLDVYDAVELRDLLRTSRRLLEQTHLPVSKAFRAGGYLGTPKMLQAIWDEGCSVDSSATDYRQLEGETDQLPRRLKQLWPNLESTAQPFFVPVPGGQLLELPISAIADYTPTPVIVSLFESAHAQLRKTPGRDVFVVLGFHQETAPDFAGRIVQAIKAVRGRGELAGELTFTTMEQAAERARAQMQMPDQRI